MQNESLCGNLANEYYVREFRRIARERRRRLDGLKTRADAEHYAADVRAKIREVLPVDSMERTPLNPKVVSVSEFGDVVCENLMFESLPDYPVTANLYRPRNVAGPLPAVLHLCGHNPPGKINKNGKALNVSLAALGMAVLTVDPLDQGERLRHPELPGSAIVRGHNLVGKRLIGCGSWFGMWRTWDAVRALDYLFTRPEVDPKRVYVTGCSGGGTMTALLTAVDDRLAGAVASCYITSWEHNVENELAADAEQMPPGLSAQGLEMADLLIAAAPRPVQISDEQDDFFDVRGAREAYEDLRKVYGLLGCEDKVRLFIGPNGHGYWQEQRAACREFLCGLAGLPGADVFDENRMPCVPDDALKVIPEASVFELPGVKTADLRLKEELEACVKVRPALTPEALRKRTAELLHADPDAAAPHYRILRPDTLAEPFFDRFLLESDEIPLGVLHRCGVHYRPVCGKEAFVYIPHAEYRSEISIWQQRFPELDCASFDPVLIGEMKPSGGDLGRQQFGSIYGNDYHYAACSLMLNRPVAGIMVSGILGAVKLLRQGGAEKITLIGAGQSSIPALLAAFLGDGLIDHTVLVNALPAYAVLFDTPCPVCPQSLIVPGFLRLADLPDLYRVVQPELREDAALPHLSDPVC